LDTAAAAFDEKGFHGVGVDESGSPPAASPHSGQTTENFGLIVLTSSADLLAFLRS
jgi:hypothetical protein